MDNLGFIIPVVDPMYLTIFLCVVYTKFVGC